MSEVIVPIDPINEQVLIAAAWFLGDEDRAALLRRNPVDSFQEEAHRPIWAGMQELVRRGLEFDVATLSTIEPDIDRAYLARLLEDRPNAPSNLVHHEKILRWDRVRADAVRGPIASLIDAIRDPKSAIDRVQSLAKQVTASLENAEATTYLADSAELIRQQISEIRNRANGHAIYPYGLDGLDYFNDRYLADGTRETRVVPGAAPEQITVITGTPGSGKTAFALRIVLGLARQRRKVLVGSWEVKAGMSLEIISASALGWSRKELLRGLRDEEKLSELERMMRRISRYVKFVYLPYGRKKNARVSNETNLDLIQAHIEMSGCEVFVADLWKKCLVKRAPDDEEIALDRQQAIAAETKTHNILVHQQRSKDVEGRPDKRPTREGIKGSGAWTEIADTMFGVHRPALWKAVDDNTMEIFALKQRWGEWPIGVEFEWDGAVGSISGGKSIPYDHPSDATTANKGGAMDDFAPPQKSKSKWKGRA